MKSVGDGGPARRQPGDRGGFASGCGADDDRARERGFEQMLAAADYGGIFFRFFPAGGTNQ